MARDTGARDTGDTAGGRLHTRIADILMAEMTAGMLPAGRHLVEAHLAERFGVSRTTIRLALAGLADQGWLDHAQGRGHVVRGVLPKSEGTVRSADADLGARHAWEAIYDQVEDEITARISGGSWQVPETALARHFGVSRTVARDVLARLQGKGLVRMDAGRWVAPALSRRRVDELYRLRAILEPAALREAAPFLDPARVGAALERLEVACVGQPGGSILNSLEQELHVDILGQCRNATLLEAIRQPQSLLIAHRFLYEQTGGLFEQEPFIAEHLAVLRALKAGKVDQAADLLRDHLMGSRARAMQRIDTVRGSADAVDIPYLRPAGAMPDA